VCGEILVQQGKNLLDAGNVIGTGGIFRYGLHPERVLRSALFDPETPWSLKPRAPDAYIDHEYMLYGVGLLAEEHPVQALRMAKRYLRPAGDLRQARDPWQPGGPRQGGDLRQPGGLGPAGDLN